MKSLDRLSPVGVYWRTKLWRDFEERKIAAGLCQDSGSSFTGGRCRLGPRHSARLYTEGGD